MAGAHPPAGGGTLDLIKGVLALAFVFLLGFVVWKGLQKINEESWAVPLPPLQPPAAQSPPSTLHKLPPNFRVQ